MSYEKRPSILRQSLATIIDRVALIWSPFIRINFSQSYSEISVYLVKPQQVNPS